jgi:GAF domain-containing protein
MSTPQRLIENLLLVTGASRAMLHLRGDNGDFAIVAEAVQHDQPQIRQYGSDVERREIPGVRHLESEPSIVVEDNVSELSCAVMSGLRARMIAPVSREGELVGAISLHHCGEARHWSAHDQDALRDARSKLLALLEPAAAEELRSAAIQAILDRLRPALDVQRCTFRQPVQEAFAFPVTFESRDAQQRSLLGDFTIVQTGQPVIVKLLAERAQVIQEDCVTASPDPLFHKMLAHYGGMRAQMVTPFIVQDQLKGVLSVHELRHPRVWTAAEKALAAEAAALIGAIAEMPRG